MTLPEWIAYYNQKNPHDPFQPTAGFAFFFVPEKGFCEARFLKDMVIIGQLAGDANFFKEKVEDVARKFGVCEGGTLCIRREIRAYIRRFGYVADRIEELPDGKQRYFCHHRESGKWGLVSPGFTYDKTGETAYFVTWEI